MAPYIDNIATKFYRPIQINVTFLNVSGCIVFYCILLYFTNIPQLAIGISSSSNSRFGRTKIVGIENERHATKRLEYGLSRSKKVTGLVF